ncbi:MAG: glutamine synthetase family protein [Candidatus Pelagadaptatus aseana]|uniref:glutamine synthetase family protein n=1 Tax=Candidatus Pelagadaptatus aseana TaxID=3120508 RepID=UPI0039B2DC64
MSTIPNPADQSTLDQMRPPEFVELLLPDCNGLLRGKRVEGDKLHKVYKNGINLPLSTLACEITGECNEDSGLGLDIGDKDTFCYPIPGSLASIDWNSRPSAQLLLDIVDESGKSFTGNPRVVLQHCLERINAMGFYPVIAVELEFFLLDQNNTTSGAPQPPINPASGQRDDNTQVYYLADLESYSDFIEDVRQTAKAQNIPAEAAVAEYAPGQFEINVSHSDDILKACDEAILLKRVIKSVARKHNFQATFMAKPYADTAGSGTHIHISLLDKDGNNVFAAPEGEPTEAMQHALGGLQQTMRDAMLMFAPNANSYRRFQKDSYVPMNPHWSYNNRTVALRIPYSDEANTRIEHRVAGADANPYLVVAAVLAGITTGLENKLDCTPAIEGNAYEKTQATNPRHWQEAIALFADSEWAKEAFGETFHNLFCCIKNSEMEVFHSQITPLEFDWYLNSV